MSSVTHKDRHSSLASFVMQLLIWCFCHNLSVISEKRLKTQRLEKRVDVRFHFAAIYLFFGLLRLIAARARRARRSAVTLPEPITRPLVFNAN
ncbi:hypothetical protein EVAR_100869_1 [Eumeta japonica]|uniref:Uncharacterized protein n=1 Tax=Eumeta variegata TaxID=151549 RepID=A0A4C1SYK1_EUMVA|nr:hypothetical protein EVAR_100869_1 [Eumeta japonica]